MKKCTQDFTNVADRQLEYNSENCL
jgi:hypothetical protein